MSESNSNIRRRLASAVGIVAVGTAWACASTPPATSIAPVGRLSARELADSSARLLDCVHAASADRGYTPARRDNPARGRFRRVDAQGYDGEWFVAELTSGPYTRLIAEAWVDSAGRPALFVTAYQTNYNRISGVEPGREKNRRLGAFLQSSVREGPGNLTPDVIEDLAEIRAACSSPARAGEAER